MIDKTRESEKILEDIFPGKAGSPTPPDPWDGGHLEHGGQLKRPGLSHSL